MTPGVQQFGRYRLLRRIGQGGMAEVYLAESEGPGGFVKRIAIKRLLPHYESNHRFVTMLRDEAHIAAAIRHPNVAEVIDFGVVDGTHYIAMEFVDGVDLAAILRTLKAGGKRLPLAASLYIGRCIAEGLEAAHSLKDKEGRPLDVIHRDVSPHNILVSYEGAVKLIDFGVAKAANNATHTKSGVIKGKLQYMSPEQAQAKPLDPRADIFSVGLSLYKMITGKLPFTGRNEYQVYDQILRKKPASLRSHVPDLPDVVDAIVLKSLRKDRTRRYQTAGEMAQVLDIALGQLDPEFGARDLAEILSRDVARPGVVDAPEDSDDFATDHGSGPSAPSSAAMDDDAIDRLTRMEAVDDAMRAALVGGAGSTRHGGTRRLSLADAVESGLKADEVADDELPPTMALPVVSKAQLAEARSHAQATPVPIPIKAKVAPKSVPPPLARAVRRVELDETPMDPEDQKKTGFHRARTEPTVRLPDPVQPASVPSLHTSQLTGLRPRRWRYIAALLITGVATAAIVVTVNKSNTAAKTSPDIEPVILDAQFVQATPVVLDATVLEPIDAALAVVVDAEQVAVVDALTVPDAAVAVEPIKPDPPRDDRKTDTPKPKSLDPAVVADKPREPVKQRKQKVVRRRAAKGFLSVRALPWAHVEVDGTRLKNHTPVQRASIRAGRRRIKLIGPDGQVWKTSVEIKAGRESRITHAF